MVKLDIFQYAAKHKLRFPHKGSIATENLYELSLEDLDKLYGKLRLEEKNSDKMESLLHESKTDTDLEVKIELVKYVLREKMEEAEKAKKALVIKQEREKILEALAKKDEESLANSTREELLARLAALGEE